MLENDLLKGGSGLPLEGSENIRKFVMDLTTLGFSASETSENQDHGIPILISDRPSSRSNNLKRLLTDGTYANLHTPNEKLQVGGSIPIHILIV